MKRIEIPLISLDRNLNLVAPYGELNPTWDRRRGTIFGRFRNAGIINWLRR